MLAHIYMSDDILRHIFLCVDYFSPTIPSFCGWVWLVW